jgi:hypothetical protein
MRQPRVGAIVDRVLAVAQNVLTGYASRYGCRLSWPSQ